jgi:hypothetical protein
MHGIESVVAGSVRQLSTPQETRKGRRQGDNINSPPYKLAIPFAVFLSRDNIFLLVAHIRRHEPRDSLGETTAPALLDLLRDRPESIWRPQQT